MPDAPLEDADAVPEHGPSTDIVRAGPARDTVLVPLDLEATRAAMSTYQQGLRALLGEDDWQGPAGAKGSFVKKSGWRKVATWFGLDIVRVHEEVERDEDGMAQRASYTAAAIAPNGRRVEATGHCAYAESRFSGPRGNATKLENDLRATAETRAKNRAIADLVGMGAVSAEEIVAGDPATPAEDVPKWGPEASDQLQNLMHKTAAYLLDRGDGPDDMAATELFNAVGTRYGYVPQAAAQAIALTAAHLKALVEGTPSPVTDPPAAPREPEPEHPKSDIPTDAEAERLENERVERERQRAEAEAAEAGTTPDAKAPSGLDPDDEPEVVDADIVVDPDQEAMKVE